MANGALQGVAGVRNGEDGERRPIRSPSIIGPTAAAETPEAVRVDRPCEALRKWNLESAPERSRTPNPQIRSLMLYPIELRAR